MLNGSSNHQLDIPHQRSSSLQIKQDDKFYSRLLSKETSMANPSFRVYYGAGSVTVPFIWESQPGTPKYTFCETTLPPLTPPPSYYSNSRSSPKTLDRKYHSSRSNLLHFLFPRISFKKTSSKDVFNFPSSPSSPASCSSTPSLSSSSFPPWSSSSSSTPTKCHKRSRFSSSGSSFDSRVFDEDNADVGSPTSTLCFSVIGRRKW